MRILHVTSWFLPGMAYQENLLPRCQRTLGHDVRLITGDRAPGRSRAHERFPHGEFEEHGVRITRLSGRVLSARHEQVLLRHLASAVREWLPDIIHTHGLWTAPTLQLLFSRLGTFPLFVDDHVDGDNLAFHRWQTRVRIAAFRRALLPLLQRRATAFLPVNPFSQRFLTHDLGIPQHRVRPLPLGVDNLTFGPLPELRQRVRADLGLPEDRVVIVTSGRLEPTKRIDVAIRSVGRLVSRGLPTALLVVGQGEEGYMQRLHALAEHEAAGQVIFHQWAEADLLNGLYNAADLALMPGKLGGMRDALAVGLPLIASSHEATSFLVDGTNGTTFVRDDPEALAAALEPFVRDKGLRRAAGERSLELVKTTLAWNVVARRSIEIYEGSG